MTGKRLYKYHCTYSEASECGQPGCHSIQKCTSSSHHLVLHYLFISQHLSLLISSLYPAFSLFVCICCSSPRFLPSVLPLMSFSTFSSFLCLKRCGKCWCFSHINNVVDLLTGSLCVCVGSKGTIIFLCVLGRSMWLLWLQLCFLHLKTLKLFIHSFSSYGLEKGLRIVDKHHEVNL